MTSTIKARQIFALLGFGGFLACAWFAYQCGDQARASASSAYAAWLNGGAAYQPAAHQNGLWVLAMLASSLFALLLLASSLYRIRKVILRKGLGVMLLAGSCLPLSFGFTILFPILKGAGGPASGPRMTSWSTGGITLRGWQMYAGVFFFSLLALTILTTGVYLFLSPARDD
jgi:hypothetical protein